MIMEREKIFLTFDSTLTYPTITSESGVHFAMQFFCIKCTKANLAGAVDSEFVCIYGPYMGHILYGQESPG